MNVISLRLKPALEEELNDFMGRTSEYSNKSAFIVKAIKDRLRKERLNAMMKKRRADKRTEADA